eukprot:483090-Hanusia_phi.AAC.1
MEGQNKSNERVGVPFRGIQSRDGCGEPASYEERGRVDSTSNCGGATSGMKGWGTERSQEGWPTRDPVFKTVVQVNFVVRHRVHRIAGPRRATSAVGEQRRHATTKRIQGGANDGD